MKIVIVGGGVVGLSCAYELSERGHSLVVVDAGSLGMGASAGNAGWITPFLSAPRAAPGVFRDALRSFTSANSPARVTPHLEVDFLSWMFHFGLASSRRRYHVAASALQAFSRYALRHYDSLRERGVAFEQYADGLAVVFKSPNHLQRYLAVVTRMRALGYSGMVTAYRHSEIRDFDPAIASSMAGVIHLESERHVRPESLTEGLAKATLANGADIIEHERVDKLVPRDDGRWLVHTERNRTLDCDQVLVAAGYSSKALVRALGIALPLEVARGTSVTAQGTGLAPRRPLKLFEDMVACSPFKQGVRLSGTFDVGRRDISLDRRRLNMVVRRGLTYLTDWQPSEIEFEWVGHRPTTSDDLPVIGSVPGHRGIYLATGHGTLGVTLGPVTGALIAREISSGIPEPVLSPFRLTRFRSRRER